jgi:hypothetical protein
MNEGITQEDLQMLIAENPLAAEQLRRIVAERQRQELQAELDDLKATAERLGVSPNGVETEQDTADLPQMSKSS